MAPQTKGRGGRRYLPYVFTEQGVVMLSTVLNSERAILVNIEIMRAFGAPRLWSKVSMQDITALVRLAFRLGVGDSARSEFWHYMNCVLADHRDKLRQGIALAAIGYHFRKLTEQYSVIDNLGYFRESVR